VYANGAVQKTLGIAPRALSEATYHRDTTPAALFEIRTIVAESLDRTAPSRREVTWHSPEGRTHCLAISATPVHARRAAQEGNGHRSSHRDGAVVSHWVVVARDVTQQHALTDRSAHAQRLESLGLLAGSAAHDFNNLIHVVTGFSELALGVLPQRSPAANYIRQAHEAALRAASLAKQLLAFSRRQSVKSVRVDLRGVLDGLRPVLARLAGPRVPVGIETGDVPAVVCADPTQMEQIFLNLVVNARDAQPNGGRVHVAIDVIQSDEAVPPDANGEPRKCCIRLRVTDAGPGMTAEIRERVFEPFFTTKAQGTGLGLSTVHRIVTENGGRIALHSPPEGGLQVEILLPDAGVAPAS
jgi:two-component system, cell cycle sensor histidine kinase and response regulator CckA